MAGNYRIFYALEGAYIGPYCSNSGVVVHGVQSVSSNTTFNLDKVVELGQLNIYSLIETVPSVEMTVEKVIDGYPYIYHLATQQSPGSDLLNRSNQRCDVFLNYYSDAQVSASGTPLTQVYCSGMYVSSINYNLVLQGHLTESVSLVNNDKTWSTSNFVHLPPLNNNDVPASGVKYRWDVNMGSGQSCFPRAIQGITAVGPSGFNMVTAGQFGAHIQDIKISCNLGRNDLDELGHRRPYYKYVNFPVQVDCSINVTAGGSTPGDLINASADTDTTQAEIIQIILDEGTIFDLGTNNRINSITYSGGDAGGSPLQITYNYINYNSLRVYAPYDPASLP